MSVVGIDLGTQSTKVGVARNKGIDIVCFPSLFRLFVRVVVQAPPPRPISFSLIGHFF